MNAERFFEDLPKGFLERMYRDQKKALKSIGIEIPEQDPFEDKLPLWRKVMLLDWLLREALNGEEGFKAH